MRHTYAVAVQLGVLVAVSGLQLGKMLISNASKPQ